MGDAVSDDVEEGAESEAYENSVDKLEGFGQRQLQPLGAGACINRHNHVTLATHGLNALSAPRLCPEQLASDAMYADVYHVALGYKILAPRAVQQIVLVYRRAGFQGQ